MMMPILAALALAAGPVSLQYEGPLKDALKEIAQKGGLNVVVAGSLDEKVQVNLTDMPAEEALETVAKVYRLDISHEGKLWVIRPAGSAAATASATPVVPAVPAVPPVPPVPPIPGAAANLPAGLDPDAVREEAERLREEAEAMREAAQEQAEVARERAQELAEAKREEAQALEEHARAQAEVARAQAEVAKQRVGTGGPVRVEKGSRVDTAVAYGGPVIVEEGAVVDGDAVAFGGDVVLEKGAEVRGDAVSFGGSVVEGEGSVVRGQAVNFGSSGLGSAMARGMVKTKKATSQESESSATGRGIAFNLFLFSTFFGLGFLLLVLAPERMKVIDASIRQEPLKNGLAGLVGSFLLMITCVGPLLLLPVGLVSVANRVGTAFPTWRLRKTQALALALGVGLLLLLWHLPWLGWPITFASAFVGGGAIIRTRFGQPSRGTPIFDPASTQPLTS